MGQLKTQAQGQDQQVLIKEKQGQEPAVVLHLGVIAIRLFLQAHLFEVGAQGWGCVKGLAMFLSLYYIHFCSHPKVY